MIDKTHDPNLRSWVDSANRPECDFPIQNLPVGVFQAAGESRARLGVAIGDFILDAGEWLPGDTLNGYLALSAGQRRDLRQEWSEALEVGAARRSLYPQAECVMRLPAAVGDYTDFYVSIYHATNVGRVFRPDNPLLPNYKHVPIAYHGRSSSLVPSGTSIRRPSGQLAEGKFGTTQEMDYEVELGAFLGPGNARGEPIPVQEAEEHIAGVCLVNDWSARDIQRWEYQPLGPFLSKNFATSLSPWIVTMEALEPFRTDANTHDVPILAYLQQGGLGGIDITVEVWLRTQKISEPVRLSRASFKESYWTLGQMVAHHTSNGCPVQPGDLVASGTISGPDKENRGCLLELTWNGTEPVRLPSGEQRTYLEDGDEVILTGYCVRDGFTRIGLGTCRGTILAAGEWKWLGI
ncbi:MAG TPA: fumarylacetoacetase [Chthoniobacterales bacterium]|nr:fumarylacetoacetase [Chthoniobacterales bacterium]